MRDEESQITGTRRIPVSLPMERTLLVLLLIGFMTWLVFAWSGYSKRYAQVTQEWALGTTRLVEVSVVAEDAVNLSCASNLEFGNLHCRYLGTEAEREPQNGPNTLQPLNTVKRELLLGAGLFTDPSLKVPGGGQRFTIVCNYHVEGVLKSASLRWSPNGEFSPLKDSVTVGHFSDCVIPK